MIDFGLLLLFNVLTTIGRKIANNQILSKIFYMQAIVKLLSLKLKIKMISLNLIESHSHVKINKQKKYHSISFFLM